jgi:RNA polymerase sigma-B factor
MESYDGFARSLALKFRHRESVDDLVQVARIGLLHAIDRFDPALGRPFPLFARITIAGELKRHIRDRTWAVRVPRSLQEDYLNVMRAVDELTIEHSGSPSMEALAERCEMSVERVVEAMELRISQRALSIDVSTSQTSDDPLIELSQEDIGFRQLENRQLLAQLLGRLPKRDRRIVELRFMEEMTQSAIAAEIGVSQMCVSRVLARTLGRLRLWARSAAA